MFKPLVLALLGMCLPSMVFAAAEITGSLDEVRAIVHPADRVVTIGGTAEQKAFSDRAVISLVVTTEHKQLSGALEHNSRLREAVTDSLVAAGIPAAAINSARFASSPQYGWFGKKPSSYQVVNRLTVTITREDHLKSVAAVADKHPEVVLADTSFEHSEKDQFDQKVKAAALDKIMAQKQAYEKSLGVKLQAVGIRDVHFEHSGTRGAEVVEEVIVTGIRSGRGRAGSDQEVPQYSRQPTFDEVRYWANLVVDFRIVQ